VRLAVARKQLKRRRAQKKKLARGEAHKNAEMIEGFATALANGSLTREERKAAAEAAMAERAKAQADAREAVAKVIDDDTDNATLYGLLRLRFNDNGHAPRQVFPELDGCAMIRELHVYGVLVAAGRDEAQHGNEDERPQHIGIGRTLMGTAELIAAAHGWTRISVIAGVGVRNYYRKLGYVLKGNGQYLIKELPVCPASDRGRTPQAFEASFIEAGMRVRALKPSVQKWPSSQMCQAAVATVGMAIVTLGAMALARRWRSSHS